MNATSLSNIVDLFIGSRQNSIDPFYISVYAESQLYFDLELIVNNQTQSMTPVIPPRPIQPSPNFSLNQSLIISDLTPRTLNLTLRNPNATLFIIPREGISYILLPSINQMVGNVSFMYNITSLRLFNQSDKVLLELTPD